jgi:Uma2 family endonuclease
MSATIADLESMPKGDGNRYELVSGKIVVTPWPKHYGGVSFRLGPILAAGVPEGHASYRLCGLDLGDGQRVFPDLCVAPHSSVGSERVGMPVLLIVEVLNGISDEDLALKRAAYAEAEVPAYWLIDPEAPYVTCMRLEDGEYRTYAEGAVTEVDWPLPARLDVAALAV